MSSTVHVLVGQCGNQLGTALFDALAAEAETSQDEDYQMRVSATHFRRAANALKGSTSSSATRHRGRGGPFDRDAPLSRLPQPRCVMVDMEPKVIDEAIQRINGNAGRTYGTANLESNPARSSYCLAPQQCVTRGEGSANNWAYGYYEQGESRRDAIAECLRRESEPRDSGASIGTYSVVHSVAGGTGSGVGCLVAEVVREDYPHASLLHSVVWPFAGGEVATQWLNAALAISTLQDTADGICVAYNDVVSTRLTNAQRASARGTGGGSARAGSHEASHTFDDLNRQIARLWAPLQLPQVLYAPPVAARDDAKYRIQQESVITGMIPRAPLPKARRAACMEDVLEAVALDPARKLFTGLMVPNYAVARSPLCGKALPMEATASSTWGAVLSEAGRSSRDTFAALPCTGLNVGGNDSTMMTGRGVLWLMRGRDARTEGLRALQDLMIDAPCAIGTLFVSPDVSGDSHCDRRRASASFSSRPLHEVTLYGHTAVIPDTLRWAVQRVEKQLQTGAYLYQYERYGVDKETFRNCTMRIWDTVHAYSGQC